jgi:hypothetical protein
VPRRRAGSGLDTTKDNRVTLGRLEKAGLVTCEQAAGLPDRPDRKVYALAVAVLGTVLAVAVLASIPARAGGRRSVAEILQAETA